MTVSTCTQEQAEMLQEEEGSVRAPDGQRVSFYIAPECAPFILTYAPRLFTGDDGRLMLELLGDEPAESDDKYEGPWPVLEIVQLARGNVSLAIVQCVEELDVFLFPTPPIVTEQT